MKKLGVLGISYLQLDQTDLDNPYWKQKRDSSHATVQEQILICPPCSLNIERAVCRTNITDGNKNNVHQSPHTESSKTEKLSNALLPVAQVESETGFGSETIGCFAHLWKTRLISSSSNIMAKTDTCPRQIPQEWWRVWEWCANCNLQSSCTPHACWTPV